MCGWYCMFCLCSYPSIHPLFWISFNFAFCCWNSFFHETYQVPHLSRSWVHFTGMYLWLLVGIPTGISVFRLFKNCQTISNNTFLYQATRIQVWVSNSPILSKLTNCIPFLMMSYRVWNKLSYCNFVVLFPWWVKDIWASVHAWYMCIFFEEMSIQILCSFKNWICLLIILIIKFLLYILFYWDLIRYMILNTLVFL